LRSRLQVLRLAGSSIAGPTAAPWVSDFLNAAYFARPEAERDVAELRLAWCILTTRWAQTPGRRLDARDVGALHRAFGLRRLRGRPRGTLSAGALLEGAAELLGDWFPGAWVDSRRRAHGVAFATAAQRDAFDPAGRARGGNPGPLTPHGAPAAQRVWHTYPAVALADGPAAIAFLLEPARWPDAAAENGRFTAIRRGALQGVTFEIEISAWPVRRLPVYGRAYVTCTAVHGAGTNHLARYTEAVNERLAARASEGEIAVPAGATPLLAVELTTHAGHFLGAGVSRLIAFEQDGAAFVRDVGSWDPLPWLLQRVYDSAGERAQAEFWGPERPAGSVLAQVSRVSAAGARA